MSRTISGAVHQVGPSAARGSVRAHSVLIDRPTDKGGSDRGPMGGELLLLALGGCFMSNLLAAIRSRESTVSDVRVTVDATIDGTPERMTAYTVRVAARYDDLSEMEKLVTIAERGCIVANTLKAGAPVAVVLEDAVPA
jgi:putative redox protein